MPGQQIKRIVTPNSCEMPKKVVLAFSHTDPAPPSIPDLDSETKQKFVLKPRPSQYLYVPKSILY